MFFIRLGNNDIECTSNERGTCVCGTCQCNQLDVSEMLYSDMHSDIRYHIRHRGGTLDQLVNVITFPVIVIKEI